MVKRTRVSARRASGPKKDGGERHIHETDLPRRRTGRPAPAAPRGQAITMRRPSQERRHEELG